MLERDEKSIKLPKTPEEFIASASEYLCSLKEPKNWSSIPLLNYTPLHRLKDYSVVRFRGMVQDMQDPEIYLERYKVKTSPAAGEDKAGERMQEGKYRDCLVLRAPGEEVVYEATENVQGERRTLILTSIPGINEWARAYEQQCNSTNVPEIAIEVGGSSVKMANKRAAPGEEVADQAMEVDASVENAGAADSNKRQCIEKEIPSENGSNKVLGVEYLLNSPIPQRPGKACMVKIYENFDTYTLNSLVDVIGFLSVDPALDGSLMELDQCADFGDVREIQALNPPPSLIPRLHAIVVHHIPHANPLCDERFLAMERPDDNTMNMLAIYKDLKMLLTLCLFNDDLAASYLLSHLISTVYCRSELENVGKFALNVCNLPKDLYPQYSEQLYGILELLLPASHYLPLTLDVLNTTDFVPKKDYETNKLVSGLLQLAPHTHLLLDETKMQQGKLEASGVRAMQSIAKLINNQQITCNFQYYDIDYNADIPVLVLSEGRSMLPTDFLVPLETDTKSIDHIEETIKAAYHYLQPSRLDGFRRFLTKAKISTFNINETENEMVQNDFVEMRKTNIIQNADDLHCLLVLSRLMSIAQGKTLLDREGWQLAKSMEEQRRRRIKEMPKSKNDRPSGHNIVSF